MAPTVPQLSVVATEDPPYTDGGHVSPTVTAALAADDPGDTLVVCPGDYDEHVTVSQTLRLEAFAGPARTPLHGVTVTADRAPTLSSPPRRTPERERPWSIPQR